MTEKSGNRFVCWFGYCLQSKQNVYRWYGHKNRNEEYFISGSDTTQANGGDTVNKTDNNHNKKNDEHRTSPANGDGKMITITLSTEKFTARVEASRVLLLLVLVLVCNTGHSFLYRSLSGSFKQGSNLFELCSIITNDIYIEYVDPHLHKHTHTSALSLSLLPFTCALFTFFLMSLLLWFRTVDVLCHHQQITIFFPQAVWSAVQSTCIHPYKHRHTHTRARTRSYKFPFILQSKKVGWLLNHMSMNFVTHNYLSNFPSNSLAS